MNHITMVFPCSNLSSASDGSSIIVLVLSFIFIIFFIYYFFFGVSYFKLIDVRA